MHAHDRQILRIIPRTVTKRLETDSKRVRVKPTRSGRGSRAKSGSKESGPTCSTPARWPETILATAEYPTVAANASTETATEMVAEGGRN